MSLLDLLFPKRCVGCKKIGNYFCDDCIKNILQTDLVCPFCERPSIGGVTHPICKRRYGLDGLWSLGVYQDPLKKAVQKLKYKWIEEIAEVLINITIEYWARFQPVLLDQLKKDKGEGWIVVPVPLHYKRQNWRGFNQSALMAKSLAKKLGLNYKECLKRTKFTTPQVKLSMEKRRQNIKGAFASTSNELRATNILLIDDVWTTGSTLKECCYILKRNGAKQVWALTLAR